jgi:CTP synthase
MNEHTEHPVVSLMEQKNITDKGGTMRLGAWKCDLKADSLAYKIYGQSTISERHRHRYESIIVRGCITKAGLKASSESRYRLG